MSNKIFINNLDVSGDVLEGLEEFTIELGLNSSTKTIGKALSSDITVEGNAYKYLREYFFSNCNNWIKTLPSLFRTSICNGINIPCEINAEGLKENISKDQITFNLKSSDEVGRAYARLDSEYITDNGFIEMNDTPIMYYVDQPNWMMWVLFYLTIQIRVFFNAIDVFVRAICKAIDLIPGVDLNCDKLLTSAIFSTFDTWITGTGRWAPAPLIREIINYQCQQAGLKFKSSILNDPTSSRYNLALLCLTGGEHGDYKDTSRPEVARVLKANEPLYTTISLLQELSQVFAADYRIIDDTLYFERVDYFDEIRTQRIFNIKDVCPEDDIEREFKTINACAVGVYGYTQDAFDQDGNSTIKIHYEGKVEYNLPYNPSQKGKCNRQLNFGPARFMFDRKAFEKRGFFNFTKFMDEFRDGPESFLSEVFFDNEGVVRKFDLVLSSSQLSLHKLLVLESGFNRKDAAVIKTPLDKKGKKQYWVYNSPMHINEDAEYAELVKDFYRDVDNPRLNQQRYKLSDIEISCNCDYVSQIINDFQRIFIETEFGKAIPNTAQIIFTKSDITIVFSDIIVSC
jgi:hypothetical protein